MISYKQKIYKRHVRNYLGLKSSFKTHLFGEKHKEVVMRDTWYLLWVIPVLMRETIIKQDLY